MLVVPSDGDDDTDDDLDKLMGPKKKPANRKRVPEDVQACGKKQKVQKKMDDGLVCKPCNHDDYEAFMPWDHTYCAEAYIAKTTNVPRRCVGVCNKPFGVGKNLDVSKYVKVTRSSPVYLCKNAGCEDHDCLFALCTGCRTKHILRVNDAKEKGSGDTRGGERNREKRQVVNPGEVLNKKTGQIVANI